MRRGSSLCALLGALAFSACEFSPRYDPISDNLLEPECIMDADNIAEIDQTFYSQFTEEGAFVDEDNQPHMEKHANEIGEGSGYTLPITVLKGDNINTTARIIPLSDSIVYYDAMRRVVKRYSQYYTKYAHRDLWDIVYSKEDFESEFHLFYEQFKTFNGHEPQPETFSFPLPPDQKMYSMSNGGPQESENPPQSETPPFEDPDYEPTYIPDHPDFETYVDVYQDIVLGGVLAHENAHYLLGHMHERWCEKWSEGEVPKDYTSVGFSYWQEWEADLQSVHILSAYLAQVEPEKNPARYHPYGSLLASHLKSMMKKNGDFWYTPLPYQEISQELSEIGYTCDDIWKRCFDPMKEGFIVVEEEEQPDSP